MNLEDRINRKKKAKLDIAYFAQEYLGYTLAPFQKKLLREVIPKYDKVLFTVARNTGKTDVVLIPIILHTHLFNPKLNSLLMSRSNDLVEKIINSIDQEINNNELLIQDFKLELQDYKRKNNDLTFNKKLLKKKSKQYTIEAKSIDSSLTGNHYDIIFFDDLEDDKSVLTPHSREKTKNFYKTTLSPLLNPGGKQIASGTFKHLDDIYNHWIKSKVWYHFIAPLAYKMPESWDYVRDDDGIVIDVENIKGKYKLLFPSRWGIKDILIKIAEIGLSAFEREYQNNIKSLQGTTLKEKWIKQCAITKKAAEEYKVELIPPLKHLEVYQGVDVAIGEKKQNDYFVVETIGVQRFPRFRIYTLDWYRDKIDFPTQIEKMKSLATAPLSAIWNERLDNGERWNPLITKIESNAYQLALSQSLIQTTNMNIKPEVSVQNKEAAIIANSVKFENGLCYLPIDHPNYNDFKTEFIDFPKGAHDDMLDSHRIATSSIITAFKPRSGMQVAGVKR
ncbi:MAG: hypothetical protein LBU40_06790 [Methanobrevibacter sp.]|jgi:predicted phage terminase large subunit-like protein|nr:hypothetical protein [Methanobrevibacter sp.]